jgi:hypothetical protein
MFDHTIDLTEPGTAEAIRRLEAYVDLRLSPSVTATTRMRMNVMNAAHRRAALIQADATAGAAGVSGAAGLARPAVRTRTRPRQGAWRRSAVALLAASLTLGILAGAASAAKPGGPLYAVRLLAETATLPSDPLARADAEVARLEERLREVQQASIDGDSSAVQAALAAYSAIVDEAERASDNDAAASAVIGASVAHHIGVLSGLLASVPASARAALEHALASSTKALDEFGKTGGNGTTGGNSGAGGKGTTGGNETNGGTGSGGIGGNTGNDGKTVPPANGGPGPDDNGQPAKSNQPDKPAPTPPPDKPVVSPKPEKAGAPSQPPHPEKSPNPLKPDNAARPSGHNGPSSNK